MVWSDGGGVILLEQLKQVLSCSLKSSLRGTGRSWRSSSPLPPQLGFYHAPPPNEPRCFAVALEPVVSAPRVLWLHSGTVAF